MQLRPLVSIISPFYNEGLGVLKFKEAITNVLNSLQEYDFEIICIDDGSTDNTLSKLIAVAHHDHRFRIIELSRNFGKEAAMTAGIDEAKGNCIIPIDADLQDPPALIGKMLIEWQQGYEVVLAKRIDRSTDSFAKRKTAQLFYRLHNVVSNLQIPEDVGDFRLMDRVVVDALKKLPERQRFMKGLFAWVGFKSIGIEAERPERFGGVSNAHSLKVIDLAFKGIFSHSYIPLKLITLCGILLSGVSIVSLFAFAISWVFIGVPFAGFGTIVSLVLLVFGFLTFMLGLIAEYIGLIYEEVKQRPNFVVSQSLGKFGN